MESEHVQLLRYLIAKALFRDIDNGNENISQFLSDQHNP